MHDDCSFTQPIGWSKKFCLMPSAPMADGVRMN